MELPFEWLFCTYWQEEPLKTEAFFVGMPFLRTFEKRFRL